MSHVLKNYLLFIWNLTRHPVFYLALLHNLERIWSIIYRILWLQLETWIWERLGRPVRRPGHGTVREMGRVNRKHKGIWKAICTSQTSCQGNRTLSLDRMGKDFQKMSSRCLKIPPWLFRQRYQSSSRGLLPLPHLCAYAHTVKHSSLDPNTQPSKSDCRDPLGLDHFS